MATISNTPRPGYVWDSTDNVWYPIGVGGHSHPDYITQATAVNPTIIDAKGDIITATAADTPARLAVGNNGETLVANSAASTGLSWAGAPVAAGKNVVINGGMDFWQRGTSFALTSPSTAYTADRWLGRHLGTNVTYSQQTSGLTGFQYSLRVQRPNAVTGTNDQAIYYQTESQDAYRFAGQTVIVSFYAKAGANYSATSSILNAGLYSGTGTNQNITSGAYTGQATVVSENKTLTTSWQRFTISGSVGSTATQLAIIFSGTPTGTAGTNDWYEITGVQLELGSVATQFSRAGGTLAGELAACQRYFYKTYPQSVTPGTATNYIGSATGTALTTAVLITPVRYAVTMRTTPTITIYHQDGTVNAVYYILTAAKVTVTGAAFASDGGFWQIDAASTLTANAVYYWHYTASAEL